MLEKANRRDRVCSLYIRLSGYEERIYFFFSHEFLSQLREICRNMSDTSRFSTRCFLVNGFLIFYPAVRIFFFFFVTFLFFFFRWFSFDSPMSFTMHDTNLTIEWKLKQIGGYFISRPLFFSLAFLFRLPPRFHDFFDRFLQRLLLSR